MLQRLLSAGSPLRPLRSPVEQTASLGCRSEGTRRQERIEDLQARREAYRDAIPHYERALDDLHARNPSRAADHPLDTCWRRDRETAGRRIGEIDRELRELDRLHTSLMCLSPGRGVSGERCELVKEWGLAPPPMRDFQWKRVL